jgi:hypothetical protein
MKLIVIYGPPGRRETYYGTETRNDGQLQALSYDGQFDPRFFARLFSMRRQKVGQLAEKAHKTCPWIGKTGAGQPMGYRWWLIRRDAATTATGVAPELLQGIEVRAKGDIGGVAGPGAQIADLLAVVGDPAKVCRSPLRMRARHGLGILVTGYDREAIEVAIAITVVIPAEMGSLPNGSTMICKATGCAASWTKKT